MSKASDMMGKAMALSLAAGTKPETIEAGAEIAKGMLERLMPKADMTINEEVEHIASRLHHLRKHSDFTIEHADTLMTAIGMTLTFRHKVSAYHRRKETT